MNFKKPRVQVLNEATVAAEDRIRGVLLSSPENLNGPIINTVTYAISMGIAEALKVLMDNVYTDQEFEEDMGFRDKTDKM